MSRIAASVATLALALAIYVVAQEAQAPTLTVPEGANYITDAEGRSVYLYAEDSTGVSTCTGRCAENWPPVTIEDELVAGSGIDPELIGSIERDDGSLQVTYAGWPLYYYARDAEAGDTRGHGLGDAFFLISPSGDPVDEPEAAQEAEVMQMDDATVATLMSEGQTIFRNVCAACHGANGEGGIGPRLDGHPQVSREGFVARTVLLGREAMPSFADRFTDREIAAVATYVRNAWSNDFGPTSPEEVRNLR